MNYTKLSRHLWVLCLAFTFSLAAQQEKPITYGLNEIPKSQVDQLGTPQIIAGNSKVFKIDPAEIMAQMNGVAHRDSRDQGFAALVSFPHPDGSMHTYKAYTNTTMAQGLADQFPEIRAYDAYDDNGALVKWDITPHGLHVMIMQPGQSTIFIDPLIRGNNQYYIVYYKKDFQTDKYRECAFDSDQEQMEKANLPLENGGIKSFGSCQLRTYRLALSATGEYTTFHGGTVGLAQAAQVTTMNRVNGVYEREMAITMVIIANNNLIVYTNSATDPFTNGNPGSMITQNQNNTNTVIGSANYDIGHVFGTNSGGLAGLGVVCSNSNKARGVTGSAAPIGDAFDIDYVAHEMGHQFGCNHTFAGTTGSCNGNGNLATAMEPGSGTTIMAYAGICSPLNVQNNSDDYFHGISLQEMGAYVTTGNGNSCPVTTALTNNAPVITSTNGNVTIPGGTPFALTAVATDLDGDPLTYNWEQMNNAFQGAAPSATATTGPNFRSLPSNTSPTRYFPALPGTSTTWERLPTVSRTMNFRVVVRDNSPGAGGCNDHEDVSVVVDGSSGPFVVTYPSATGITWAGNSTQTVTWTVAGTATGSVACANVDIFLSTDGGATYPTLLANNVPNDGSQSITVPNTATTTARIMVMCENGTFFDVSDNNFTITAATFDYTLGTTPTTVSICQPNNATFTVNVGSIGGYNSPVTLSVSGVPAGATSSFSVNPVTPVGTSVLTINNTGAAAPGTYTLTITGNSAAGTKTTTATLVISSGTPGAVTLTSPANGAASVAMPVNFAWTAAVGAGVSYTIQIATDAGFASIVEQASALATNSYTATTLLGGTTYYWRVQATTGCGTSAWSSTFSFTTSNCGSYASTDVPKAVGAASVTSVLNIPTSGLITDVNVNLNISHVYVGDLRATLTSPTGTIVELFNGPGIPASTYGCAGDNIIASFDETAGLTATDFENMCNGTPPAITGTFQSIGLLSLFNGQSMTGTWTLTVYDSYTAGDNGTLNSWSLDVCFGPNCTAPTAATISGPSTSCPGTPVTLSVTGGNLNSATNWQWYSGSCGGTAVGTGTSISVSPSTTTTYYIRGEGGCVSPGSCTSFTVNAVDNTPPTLVCPGNQTVNKNAACQASLPSYIASATATDNCTASPTKTQSPAAGTLISVPTLVTITATDAAGNNTSCSFTVTPVDVTPPTISCPGNQTVSANASCQAVLANYTGLASATDNCTTTTITQSPAAGTTITGATTVTLTATDGSGNTTTCTFQVSPIDNTAPTLVCPGNQTVSLGAGCAATLPDYTTLATATDACTASPTKTQAPAAGTVITVATLVTITATDAAGNSTSCSFTVTPVDNTAPVIVCPGTQTDCVATVPDYTALGNVSDGCDANPTVTQFPPAGSPMPSTSLTVTLTATDAAGNSSNCSFDVVPGIYSGTASATICFGDSYTFPDGTVGTTSQTQTSYLTSSQGCDSTITTQLTVLAQLDASVTQSGGTLTATATGVSYQWIDCDNNNAPIAGASSQSFTPTATTGNYAVVVSSGNCSETSACYLVDFTGIEELTSNFVNMYPNPVDNQVTLTWSGEVKRIELTDAQGKLILLEENVQGNSYTMHVEQLSGGMYFVHVLGNEGRQVLELIKD
jgi:subtilisin-like proprotein convertase family protein